MTFQIGSKYEETKQRLKRKIRENSTETDILIPSDENNHTCCLCLKKIKEQAIELFQKEVVNGAVHGGKKSGYCLLPQQQDIQ